MGLGGRGALPLSWMPCLAGLYWNFVEFFSPLRLRLPCGGQDLLALQVEFI